MARNTPWDGGLVAVNSFGFGGANAHIILESHARSRAAPAALATGLPRLVLASGRSDDAVRALLQLAQAHRGDTELHALLDAVHALPVAGHPRRGYRLLLPDGDEPQMEIAVSTLFVVLLFYHNAEVAMDLLVKNSPRALPQTRVESNKNRTRSPF